MASYRLAEDQRASRQRSQAAGFVLATGFAAASSLVLIATVWSDRDAMSASLMAGINPNTATVASLARLPGIGWTRAQAIVVYRERVVGATPGAVAFKSPEDLQRIRGIGPKTAQGLAPWLEFD
jgi:competence ComEA-like helix-hairpin-helix protein